jgi:rhamnulokinase
MTRYHLAIDIGASNGRHMLGHVEEGRIVLEEVYRFDNMQVRRGDHDCWDIEALYDHILTGLRACADAGKIPITLGVDAWGVDFVLLDRDGCMVGDAVAYRDARTQGIPPLVDEKMSPGRIYHACGIQRQRFNTLYQLVALSREHPGQLAAARRFLTIPDYFNYLLTGVACNEYTTATTTNLLDARTKDWDADILSACGIPQLLFAKPLMPGAVLGGLSADVRDRVGFDCRVVLPATHNTGSAFLAVSSRDEDAVCISSGTWSLLGVEHEGPITTEAARLQNFTNEGGFESRFRFLKNIMGLWMVQSIRRELNGIDYVEDGGTRVHAERKEGDPEISFDDLMEAAQAETPFGSSVNVNDERFLAPGSMIDEIGCACREAGQPVPQTTGQLMQCVYRSLAACYADTIADLAVLTGREYTSVNIVGGGCRDGYLNRLTADSCGLPVFAGPAEGAALGNLIVQFLVDGYFPDLQVARDAIRDSFDIEGIDPS